MVFTLEDISKVNMIEVGLAVFGVLLLIVLTVVGVKCWLKRKNNKENQKPKNNLELNEEEFRDNI